MNVWIAANAVFFLPHNEQASGMSLPSAICFRTPLSPLLLYDWPHFKHSVAAPEGPDCNPAVCERSHLHHSHFQSSAGGSSKPSSNILLHALHSVSSPAGPAYIHLTINSNLDKVYCNDQELPTFSFWLCARFCTMHTPNPWGLRMSCLVCILLHTRDTRFPPHLAPCPSGLAPSVCLW